jgi:hypothetical protein
MHSATEKPNWGARLDAWLCSTGLLISGMAMAIASGDQLIQERFPHFVYSWPVVLLNVLAFLFVFLSLFKHSPVSENRIEFRIEVAGFLMLLGFCVTAWQRDHLWAVLGIGPSMAIFFFELAKLRERSFVIAVAGWILAVCAAVYLPWPNGQRYLLVLVLGGFGTALQGAFDLPRNLPKLTA